MRNFVYYYFLNLVTYCWKIKENVSLLINRVLNLCRTSLQEDPFVLNRGKSEKKILCFISRSRLGRRICYSTFIKLTLLKCPLSFPPREYIYLNNEIMCYKLYPLTLNHSLKYAFTKDGKEATV